MMERVQLDEFEAMAQGKEKSLLLITEIRFLWDLLDVLEYALKTVKCDAQKNGFEYGSQSVCEKALTKAHVYKHKRDIKR